MSIEPGTTLLHYRLAGKIGEGGMGEVWRATDTTLGRDVAIKVLPPALYAEADRLLRFEREAKLLAALNHPNIAAIYGFHEAEGVRFLAMELVEGPDLSQRLAGGKASTDEAIRIAMQIAEGLEYAHERNIVHRDLKPANVKITPDGQVKILDFGLAKALTEEVDGKHPTSSPTMMPTVTSGGTQKGMILGTAAYMSPEQARGHAVDRRTDIWAFGCVLYEILSGGRAFEGDTVTDVLAAVVTRDPDWTKLSSAVPEGVRTLLGRCLEKDARRRLRDIGEARVQLETLRAGAVSGTGFAAVPQAPPRPGFLRTHGGWIAAGIVVIAALALQALTGGQGPADVPLRKAVFTVPTEVGAPDPLDPAISPDGRLVAYVHGDRLWIRDLEDVEPRPIAGTEDVSRPFWSPDGRSIGYFTTTRVMKVSREGGRPAVVGAMPSGLSVGSSGSGAWDAEGKITVGTGSSGLIQFPAQGGSSADFLATGAGESDFHEVARLPGGRGWIFVVHGDAGIRDIDLLRPDGSRSRLLHAENNVASPAWSSSGHIVYEQSGDNAGIWAFPFDLDTLERSGAPFPVAAGGEHPSVAEDGTLAYFRGVPNREAQLVWFDRRGAVIDTLGEPTQTLRPFPVLSKDERSLIQCETFLDSREVVRYDVATGTRRRLTFDDERKDVAFWHPNGRDILYYESNTYWTYVLEAGQAGSPRRLVEGIMVDMNAEGKHMVLARISPGAWDWDLVLCDAGDPEGSAVVLVDTPHVDWWPRISPDGRYLLYTSNETGRDEVYVTTFPDPTARWQVSSEGGIFGEWRSDGREILYTTHDRIWSVPVTPGQEIAFGAPRPLFQRPTTNWSVQWPDGFDVTADGQRFVMMQPVTADEREEPALVVVQNWFREFETEVR